MLEKTLTKIKRGLLFLSIPFVTGCLGPGYVNEVYQQEEEFVEVKKDTLKKKPYYDFEKSIYSSSLGWDSDHDGIINYDDPWPYIYGPFVDRNGNGIVDITDWQISGYGNFIIEDWVFYSHYRWIGNSPNPWRDYYFNLFYYFQRGEKESNFVYTRREGNTTTNYDTRRNEEVREEIYKRRESSNNFSQPRTYERRQNDNSTQINTRRTGSENNTSVRRTDNSNVRRNDSNENRRVNTNSTERRSSNSNNSNTQTRRR